MMKPFEKTRLARGLTRQELAEKLGITQPAVRKWETGQSKPSPEFYPKLAKIFRMDAREVVDLFAPSPTDAAA